MSMGLFRFIAVVGRTQLMANTLGSATLVAVYILGGFVISRGYYFEMLSHILQIKYAKYA